MCPIEQTALVLAIPAGQPGTPPAEKEETEKEMTKDVIPDMARPPVVAQ